MARRKTLSDAGVAALKAADKRYAFPDPELRGHYIRVAVSGAKTYVAVTRDPSGKQIWASIDDTTRLTIAEARERARVAMDRIAKGLEAFPPAPRKEETFADVWAAFYQQHVLGRALRSGGELKRVVEKHALPVFAGRPFTSITRSDVARLLDDVEEESGAPQADKLLAHLSSISNWFAARHDTYSSPIVKGMKRSEAASRERVLDDAELKVIWATAARLRTPYADAARIMLLTAQRRAKIASMQWTQIGEDGLWSIATEPREKENPRFLILPKTALDIIRSRPVLTGNPFIFAGKGAKAMNSWSQMKAEFDEETPGGLANWTTHDLRRTARSLMSRAGVLSEHAERVLGHALPGVEGVYDRYHYAAEKKAALAALEKLVREIVS